MTLAAIVQDGALRPDVFVVFVLGCIFGALVWDAIRGKSG